MIENKLIKAWQAGRPTLNGWLSINSGFVAEIMAEQGYDSLTVDMQHGALGYEGALAMLQAMRASGVVPMVRVPWLDPAAIMKALDAGAYGIICPMISTADEAAAFVACLRYPPLGQRSFGPTRVNFAAGPGYAAEANEQILGFAMIETAEAVANLKSIVATPGLDGVYIGPADLTLGVTRGRLAAGFDREEPEMIEVIRNVLAVAKAAGRRAGMHCATPAYGARAIGWGFDFATISNDVRMLAAAASGAVAAVRAAIGDASGARAEDETKGS